MKILFCSDIHNDLRYTFEIVKSAIDNEVDCIAIAGDLTNFGTQKELDLILQNLDCGIKLVFIAGNHDQDMSTSKFRKKIAKYPNYTYLQNEYATINGIKFYGMPQTLRFRNWWFMCSEKDFIDLLPSEDVDIILAHQPPSHKNLSMCDNAFGECDIGSTEIKDWLQTANVKYYICGHNHEQGGNSATIGNCKVINVANSIKIIEVEGEIDGDDN